MLFKNRWSWGRQIYWGVMLFLLFFFLSLFFYDTSLTFKTTANFIIAIVALLIAYYALGSFKIFKKNLLWTQSSWIWRWIILIVVIILLLVEQVPTNILQVLQSKFLILNTMTALAAAILEEAIFRGLFFSGFLGHAIYESSTYKLTKAALYSALIFGFLHLVNITSMAPQAVFEQMVYTFAAGTFLAVLRIITNRLLWVIILHFLIDWSSSIYAPHLNSGSWGDLLIILVPLFLVSIVYLIYADKLLLRQTA
ncbi:metal-dependent membrane protease [Liquorilactobacillus ghanensis DSM 18630]|uniref:Metal-dependent membrane protease n=1 Tax=Liquorilactobacillus ghanensis DSM 18630 TaxID=1423750 RepID=A0A0R1VUX3_9LACO|nr:CPBP family intramembrane glutamic endopeptidase [Liquorilactobacillus ghanensis]KRM05292.1 metal-dependent membrane protease [Liquorilactobacillus ghanensis DSM 18630]